jgi:hypothetical protein
MFAPTGRQQGLLDTVLRNAATWVEAQKVPGLKLEIVRLEGRTPVLFFEVEGTQPENASGAPTVLMYGHLDKQPEFEGWRSDLGPGRPVYEDGKLYGRGGADDGYAVYASVAACRSSSARTCPPAHRGHHRDLRGKRLPRSAALCGCLRPRLGDVGLVICLDSGAGNYDQLWLTTSLRGMASGTLKVEILTEGVHSGDASGVVPSSFRIMRQVLDRLEDSATGRLLPASFHCEVPPERWPRPRHGGHPGRGAYKRFPWAHHDCGGSTLVALPTTTDPVEALLKRTWEPTLSVTGAEGLPNCRTPAMCCAPTRPSSSACACRRWWTPHLRAGDEALLEDNAPYQAKVTWEGLSSSSGWNAPGMAPGSKPR